MSLDTFLSRTVKPWEQLDFMEDALQAIGLGSHHDSFRDEYEEYCAALANGQDGDILDAVDIFYARFNDVLLKIKSDHYNPVMGTFDQNSDVIKLCGKLTRLMLVEMLRLLSEFATRDFSASDSQVRRVKGEIRSLLKDLIVNVVMSCPPEAEAIMHKYRKRALPRRDAPLKSAVNELSCTDARYEIVCNDLRVQLVALSERLQAAQRDPEPPIPVPPVPVPVPVPVPDPQPSAQQTQRSKKYSKINNPLGWFVAGAVLGAAVVCVVIATGGVGAPVVAAAGGFAKCATVGAAAGAATGRIAHRVFRPEVDKEFREDHGTIAMLTDVATGICAAYSLVGCIEAYQGLQALSALQQEAAGYAEQLAAGTLPDEMLRFLTDGVFDSIAFIKHAVTERFGWALCAQAGAAAVGGLLGGGSAFWASRTNREAAAAVLEAQVEQEIDALMPV